MSRQPSLSQQMLLIGAVSVVLAWPMLLVSAPLIYFDTLSYLGMGEQTLALAKSMMFPTAESGGGGAAETVASGVRLVRAVSYSVFVYVTSQTPLGLILPVLGQTALTLGMLLPFVRDWTWNTASLAALGLLVGFSTLPWIASYAMPDILAAGVIIWAGFLMRGVDAFGWRTIAAMTLIATFAVSAHYGHIPLAFALTAFVLLVRAVQRRVSLRLVMLGPIPIVASLIVNLSASAIALDQPSFAPKRLPILLARSLEDGPAAWFLHDHCDSTDFAMCDLFADNVPENITEFLWAPDGIRSLSAADLDAIRSEEKAFLIATFKAYPIAQTWSLVGNGLRQIITVGTGELRPIDPNDGSVGDITPDQSVVLNNFDWITKVGTLLACVAVLMLWARGQLNRAERDLALVIVVGLLVNAVIFGGLSAPVDRYQSRVVWLIPALLLLRALRKTPAT
ncbi:MAG: hypothetical protein AB8B51_01050 [Sedimentitalea sp.]